MSLIAEHDTIKIIMWLNSAAILFGQKRNLIIQYSNQLFEIKQQVVNIDIKYLFSFSRQKQGCSKRSGWSGFGRSTSYFSR